MQCDMPGCQNKKAKKFSSTEIINGVNIGHQIFYACCKHHDKEILEQANKFFESKAALVQLANPMHEIKVQKNTVFPSK